MLRSNNAPTYIIRISKLFLVFSLTGNTPKNVANRVYYYCRSATIAIPLVFYFCDLPQIHTIAANTDGVHVVIIICVYCA